MESGLARLGIRLREEEWALLGKAIERYGRFNYVALVRELSGVPQNEFADSSILKFAKFVEENDISREALK
jgi:hypothetical protein